MFELEYALKAAVEEGDVESARWLLGAGADPNFFDPYDEVPIMLCFNEDKPDALEMLKLLVDYGGEDASYPGGGPPFTLRDFIESWKTSTTDDARWRATMQQLEQFINQRNWGREK